MSVPCKFERSLLSHEEYETMRPRLRKMHDKERTLSRQMRREGRKPRLAEQAFQEPRPFVPAHRQCHAISSLGRDFGLKFGDARGQHV
jgi:hypothetical protein